MRRENFQYVHEDGFTRDLLTVKKQLQDHSLAQEVYAALCNNDWQSLDDPDMRYGCSWRYAGGLVAEIRDQGEDYLEFYCTGIVKSDHDVGEGFISDRVRTLFLSIGWIEYREEMYPFRYNDKIYIVWTDRLVIYGEGFVITDTENVLKYIKEHFTKEKQMKIQKWMFGRT